VKKICEIDPTLAYSQTDLRPFTVTWRKRRYRVNPKWFDAHFNTAQKQILEKYRYTIRPHPRHNPTIELFIDETELEERDWTMIRLLF